MLQRMADEHGVASGGDGELRRVGYAPDIGDGAHLQVVGDAATAEPDVLAQQPKRDRRERRRKAIERLESHVRRHHRSDARARRGHERDQLDFPEAFLVVREAGERQVGVLRSVAVTRKVLRATRHAGPLQSLRKRHAEPRDPPGIAGERTVADDRVVRIGIHVEHRREIDVDSRGRKLAGDHLAHPLGDHRPVRSVEPSLLIEGGGAAGRARPPGRRR